MHIPSTIKVCVSVSTRNGGTCQNRITAWFFGTDLNKRMMNEAKKLSRKKNRVDVLITGCEVKHALYKDACS